MQPPGDPEADTVTRNTHASHQRACHMQVVWPEFPFNNTGNAARWTLDPCKSGTTGEQLDRNSFKHLAELTRKKSPDARTQKKKKPEG